MTHPLLAARSGPLLYPTCLELPNPFMAYCGGFLPGILSIRTPLSGYKILILSILSPLIKQFNPYVVPSVVKVLCVELIY
jgi:hypothetical protein